MGDRPSGSWLKPMLKALSPQFREVAFLSLFINLLALALPVFILQVYDRVVFYSGLTTLQGLVIGMVVVIAFDFLLRQGRSRLMQRSALYRSAPFGGVEQADFVNAVATMLTQLSAGELLLELQRIEQARGRERGAVRWGPRILDLDLLVYSNQEIDEDKLTVPHPGIGERNFVLLPLEDVAPELVIPGLGPLANISVSVRAGEISRIG